MRSSQGAADEVTVLLQRARQHGEMHLPILVDSYDPDHRLAMAVPGHQHHTRTNLRGIAGMLRADQPSPSSSSALRSATRSISGSITSPPYPAYASWYGSGCVVEDQRQGESLAGADHRHPVPDGCGR